MIKFDASLIKTKIVFLKQITTALGGSMLALDHPSDDLSTATRYDLPLAVARKFVKTHHLNKYLIAVPTAVVWYGESIVSIERHPLGTAGTDLNNPSGVDYWMPESYTHVEYDLPKLTAFGDWYFDGRYAYTFKHDLDTLIEAGKSLTSDNQFKSVQATAIDLYSLSRPSQLGVKLRECLAFVASTGDYALTSPLWETVESIMATMYKKGEAVDVDADAEDEDNGVSYVGLEEEDNANKYWLDRMNQEARVNLAFALYAGNSLGKVFDYEHVDALRLPELMIELCTVNMPGIDSSVRSTYPIGMSLTNALAWTIGMLRNETDHTRYMAVLQCIKYLCKRGVYKGEIMSAVFLTDEINVPLFDVQSNSYSS